MRRIAIASSGLGHIHRGIESWAQDMARALHDAGESVTLFQGGGVAGEAWSRVIPCLRRNERRADAIVAALSRRGGWRYGCGSDYELEQTTFALSLWPRIRRRFDILHVQDPQLALILDTLQRRGLSRPRVILAHGTQETPRAIARFSCVQHLAPNYREEFAHLERPECRSFAIPNFVDVSRFAPGDQAAARRAWGLPADAFIVLSVAAIKRTHKRIDALIREFAAFRGTTSRKSLLIVAGARESESEAVMRLGNEILGDGVVFLTDVDRRKMPSLYRAADVFALASLFEMMPIAVLEAMASGLPIACNDTPTLRWMVGEAGFPSDIGRSGDLANQLALAETPETRHGNGMSARRRAVSLFSTATVTRQIQAMYDRVLTEDRAAGRADSAS